MRKEGTVLTFVLCWIYIRVRHLQTEAQRFDSCCRESADVLCETKIYPQTENKKIRNVFKYVFLSWVVIS